MEPRPVTTSRRRHAALVLGLALAAALTALGAATASAEPAARFQAEPVAIAEELDRTGAYVDPSSSADEDDVRAVTRAIADGGDRWGLVVLDEEPAGGATIEADRILDALSARDSQVSTVAVLVYDSAGRHIGVVSDVHDDAAIDRGLDRAADRLRSDAGAGFAALYSAVSGRSLAGLPGELGDAGSVGSGGIDGAWILVGVVALLVLGAGLLWQRSKRSRRRRLERQIEVSREELRAQVSAMADTILNLDDRVTMATPEVRERFAGVNATYAEVLERVDAAESLPELEQLADRMDAARWEIGAIEAVLDGRPEPVRPVEAPAACFFDPTHGAGTEQEELRTPAGVRMVGVCRTCADALARGEQPDPRTVDVDGAPVPAPGAPRSAGGGGIDLGGILQQVLVGGVLMGGLGGNGRYPRARGPFGGSGPFGAGSGTRARPSGGAGRATRAGGANRGRGGRSL